MLSSVEAKPSASGKRSSMVYLLTRLTPSEMAECSPLPYITP
ncbi:MAG: hypothetical protein QXU11_03130 [Thermoproteota archaeon]